MKIPETKITIDNNWEVIVFNLKWDTSLLRYKDLFRTILQINWFKEDKIKKLWL